MRLRAAMVGVIDGLGETNCFVADDEVAGISIAVAGEVPILVRVTYVVISDISEGRVVTGADIPLMRRRLFSTEGEQQAVQDLESQTVWRCLSLHLSSSCQE